jgi:cytochrome c553
MRKGTHVIFGLLAAVLFFAVLAFGACATSKTEPRGTPEDLVMTACTACHDTQRICSNLENKDKDAWTLTVTRMKDKGAALGTGDIARVAEYLAGLKAGAKPVCK